MPSSSTFLRGRRFLVGALCLVLALAGAAPTGVSGAETLPDGPWGLVTVTPLPLTPPSSVAARLRPPRASTWELQGPDLAAIDHILAAGGLSGEQRETVLALGAFDPARPGRWTVTPPDALRWSLTPAQRRQLYHELARFEGNPSFILPGVLPASPAAWGAADLNPELHYALDRLSFPRRGMRCLADGDLLTPFIRDEAEHQRLLRLLTTIPAVKLELTRASLERRATVAAYWQLPGGRSADAVLAWFDAFPDVETIDVVQLLPPRSRAMINTYAAPRGDGLLSNCFWTALNFNQPATDDRLLARGTSDDTCGVLAAEILARDFEEVSPPYHYGDVLALLLDVGGQTLLEHTMVHVAGDIVLTKNGYTAAQPYVFMRRADLDRAYPYPRALRLVGYRRRADPPAP